MPTNRNLPQLGTPFTPAELPIIAGLARGHTIPQIAETLGKSPLTIKSHVWRLSHRTGMHSRAGIVGYAYRHGYLTRLTTEPRLEITLTRSQTAVLAHLAEGLDSPAIAAQTFRATNTIKTHRRLLFAAMGANTAAHAVALGYQHGHLTITQPAPITNAA